MLHGEIEVNDRLIMEWTAVNTGMNFVGTMVYTCTAAGRDSNGAEYQHSFGVLHRPEDGAASLVWGIMKKVTELGVK